MARFSSRQDAADGAAGLVEEAHGHSVAEGRRVMVVKARSPNASSLTDGHGLMTLGKRGRSLSRAHLKRR